MMNMKYVVFTALAAAAAGAVEAKVAAGTPFADNMVLQQGRAVAVWGTADAGEQVTGRFLPLTDHFTSVELQSGAVLDLSTQTGVWSTQSLDINNVNNGGAFHYVCTFADEAVITVDLSGRHFTQGEQIVSWEEVPENLDSLKFKPDEVSRLRYALQKRNEGLFAVSSSLVIYVR